MAACAAPWSPCAATLSMKRRLASAASPSLAACAADYADRTRSAVLSICSPNAR
jgi:hypothetical protein